MRSLYKLFINRTSSYVVFDSKLKKKFNSVLGKIDKNPDFIVWKPSSAPIYPGLFGKKLVSHSGNSFTSFQVRRSMFFFKPSAFVRTKRLGSLIHTVKRKRKK